VRFAALFIHGLQFTLCEAVTTLSYDLLCLAAASCNKCYFFCKSQFCYGTTVFVGQRVCGIMTPRGLLVLVDLYIAEERFCTRPHLFIKVVIHPHRHLHFMNPVSSRATKAKRLQKAQSARFQTPFESPHILITPQSKGGNGWICDYIHDLSPL